jgi:FtsP/CotA-like multicopper oxidase with cupredoxin domain
MRAVFSFLFFLATLLSLGQVQDVWLTTQMTGTHDLGNGQTTTIWGYGYDSLGVITLPAPLLEFTQGDSVRIHMINDSPESHTIHLHGLDVDQVNDGVPSTSFYIISNDTGHYSFRADEVGGFLYHCHVTTTLHLTLGMYGMIGVNAPNNQVYAGGPDYDRKYHFLASDLEVATNDAPLLAFPFHEIIPDHFMINGKAGASLAGDTANIIFNNDGEDILLRLGSLAYSKTVFNFPVGTNPLVLMSDGRVLPNSFTTNQLTIYPGERYSVLLSPDSSFVGQLTVDYYSMLNDQLVGTNQIAINRTDLGLKEVTDTSNQLTVYPNPSTGQVTVEISDAEERIDWFSPNGRLIASRICMHGKCTFNTGHLAPRVYFVRSSRGGYQRIVVN